MKYEKPLIKWVGGKSQILDQILNKFPSKIENYHELFLGGGSVLLGFLECVKAGKICLTGKIYASDINETLIHLYINIQRRPRALIKELIDLTKTFNSIEMLKGERAPKSMTEALKSQESFYYWKRQKFNAQSQAGKNSLRGSAHFIFLNKTCFRGLWREGPNGFNVPFGHYKSPEIFDIEHILRISKLIKNVEFRCLDFEEAWKDIRDGDFLYLDPPYVPENKNSFVGYKANGFAKHEILFKLCRGTKARFLLSNSNTDLVKNEFDDFDCETITCKRRINPKNPEAMTNELMIWN